VKGDGVTENNSLWMDVNQLSVPRDKKKLTRSDQGNENCDDHEEYRYVFHNLWGLSIPHGVWEHSNTHDGATLLPQFDIENGCMYLL
jgi:hypothetical protein